jgi:hypothetical protein
MKVLKAYLFPATLLCFGCAQRVSEPHLFPQTSTPSSQIEPNQSERGAADHTPSLPWWQQIQVPDDEIFVGATADGSAALWVRAKYRQASAGTRVAFLHWEKRDPPPPFFERSELSTEDFDCVSGKSRTLEVLAYSDRMTQGSVVHSEVTPWEWHYVVPDSMIDAVAKKLCLNGKTSPAKKKPPKPMKRVPQSAPQYL